jgi:hypothetical protein
VHGVPEPFQCNSAMLSVATICWTDTTWNHFSGEYPGLFPVDPLLSLAIDVEPNVLSAPSLRRSWTPKSAWRKSNWLSYSECECDCVNIFECDCVCIFLFYHVNSNNINNMKLPPCLLWRCLRVTDEIFDIHN